MYQEENFHWAVWFIRFLKAFCLILLFLYHQAAKTLQKIIWKSVNFKFQICFQNLLHCFSRKFDLWSECDQGSLGVDWRKKILQHVTAHACGRPSATWNQMWE